MTKLAEDYMERYFGGEAHPYQILVDEVERHIGRESVLLDAGCGRTAPVLRTLAGKAARRIGVDLVDFTDHVDGVELIQADLGSVDLPDNSVDVIMSRSVMEHVVDPPKVYREMWRILKPGGHFIFLTGNLWDYSALLALLIPNRYHPRLVAKTQGRAEEDVFPVAYKTNSYGAVKRWTVVANFELVSFRYLGQYPAYFMFNGFFFLIATAYEKLIRRFESLRFLRGWILVTLRKPG
jgi:SAM-dependent methyltransferase